MSGIEVAGLVLGALPLLIAAIEKYKEGLDPLTAFYSWEKELPKYVNKLRVQHVHYEQTLKLLFGPITTETQLVEMMADPLGGWNDEEMAERLRLRLDEAYDAYQSIMAEILKIATKIASKLDLERASTVSRSDLEAMLVANPLQSDRGFQFRKRVKFGISKKRIKGLLDDLDNCNKQLERLTDKSDKLEPYRQSRKTPFAQRVQRIQVYARSLHDVLVQSWTCACQPPHTATLQLEQRLDLDKKKKKKNIEEATDNRFSVSFRSSCKHNTWTWQDAQIDVSEKPAVEKGEVLGSLCLSPTPTLLKKAPRGVSFDTPPPTPLSVTSRASTLVGNSSTTSPAFEDVKDMCAIISKHFSSADCIAFSMETGGTLRGGVPTSSTKQKSSDAGEMVSLEALLSQPPSQRGMSSQLSKKERYMLAVTLASSALQLYATPWIEDQWGKEDILFRRTPTTTRPVDVEHPYVKHKSNERVTTPKSASPKNTVLLALAVTLLELYFGQSCETLDLGGLQSGTGPQSPWILLAMTSAWLSREEENLSYAFSTAVKSCLQFFHDSGNSLVETKFLQQAIDGILVPLQDELCSFLGGAPT